MSDNIPVPRHILQRWRQWVGIEVDPYLADKLINPAGVPLSYDELHAYANAMRRRAEKAESLWYRLSQITHNDLALAIKQVTPPPVDPLKSAFNATYDENARRRGQYDESTINARGYLGTTATGAVDDADRETPPNVGTTKWKVYCAICTLTWEVPYHHPGKSICETCERMAKATHDEEMRHECEMVGCNNTATRGTPPKWCASCAASIMFDVERPDLNL